jgi:uncharacterized membrane protein YkgB
MKMVALWLKTYDRLEVTAVNWLARHAIGLLRVSIGIVFLWFGALKFFPGLSPAEQLAAQTIERLTFGFIPAATAVVILAAWECLIGLGMLVGIGQRLTLALLLLQMAGTMTPLVLFPQATFSLAPLVPTLEGQYIIKNLVIISGALVIGATLRGRSLTAAFGADNAGPGGVLDATCETRGALLHPDAAN